VPAFYGGLWTNLPVMVMKRTVYSQFTHTHNWTVYIQFFSAIFEVKIQTEVKTQDYRTTKGVQYAMLISFENFKSSPLSMFTSIQQPFYSTNMEMPLL
jgi:hypothetical protein